MFLAVLPVFTLKSFAVLLIVGSIALSPLFWAHGPVVFSFPRTATSTAGFHATTGVGVLAEVIWQHR